MMDFFLKIFRRYEIQISLVVTFTVLILTSYVHQITSPFVIRYLFLLLLGSSVTFSLRFFIKQFPLEQLVPVFLFTLIWGHTIFNGYVYYDEFWRFVVISVPSWIKFPINDHLQPLMFPLWYFQYAIGKGLYPFISIPFYLFGVTAILSFSYMVSFFCTSLGSRKRRIIVWISSVPTHCVMFWSWKGCGDAPLISFMWFSLFLVTVLRLGKNLTLKDFLLISLVYNLATWSSSANTLGFVFLIPFLLLSDYRKFKFFILIGLTLSYTVLYWIYRSMIIPNTLHDSIDILQAFLTPIGVIKAYSFEKVWITFPLFFFIGSGLATLSSKKRKLLVLGAIAIIILLLGTAQIMGGRGANYDSIRGYASYHLFFPYWGVSILVALGVAYWEDKVSDMSLKVVFGLIILATLIQINDLNHSMAKRHNVTIELRREFFKDLEALRPYPIPDFDMYYSNFREELDWYPDPLPGNYTLYISYFQKFIGGNMKIVATDSIIANQEVEKFKKKWINSNKMTRLESP